MIELTKMNQEKFYINPNLIEIVETTPDTLISTMSGKKYYVLETAEEVSTRLMEYYVNINTRSRKQRKQNASDSI
jgi:flagellar protein FlbD